MSRAASLARLGAAVAAWLAIVQFLPGILVRNAPSAVQRRVSQAGYLAGVELVDLALGAGLVFLAVPDARRVLALVRPARWSVPIAALLAPALSALASAVALAIAMPWLLDELATRGAHASRENAGELGRVLSTEPLVATILFGSVLAALGEELLFRGALFGFLREAVNADERPGLARDLVIPTLGAAAVFALLHADMHGAVGLVRVIATATLAIACGAARFVGRSVLVPVTLHLVYNLVAIAQVRGLFAAISNQTLANVPAGLVAAGATGVAFAAPLAWLARRRA